MNRRLLIAFVAVVLAAAGGVAAGAVADGPPQGVAQDGVGVVSPDGKLRYLTVVEGQRTLLESVSTRGGALWSETLLRGRFSIPAIAWTPTGMTPDAAERGEAPAATWHGENGEGAPERPFRLTR